MPEPKLRLWPALALLATVAVSATVPPLIAPRTMIHFGGVFGGFCVAILGTLIWWTVFSRAKGLVRWLPPLLFAVVFGTAVALYPGLKLSTNVLFAMVLGAVLWLVAAIASYPLGWPAIRVAVPAALLAAIGLTLASRVEGTSADLVPEISWRWNKTSEQLAMADRKKSADTTVVGLQVTPGDWPQFRGPKQDSRVNGATIRTDWAENPPKPVWKKRVGPGWGSFAVVGDYLFTQEQREANEAVVCLKAATGEEVWSYESPARFAEAISGVGPRGTPTVADGSVYAYGATGKLCRLDAATGKKIWEVDVPATAGTPVPPQFWGYASSPYVANGLVVVFTNGGAVGKGTVAFKVADGTVAWAKGIGTHGYAMAHRTTICGVDQLLMQSDKAIEAFEPTTGKLLWSHEWVTRANRSTQPILLGNDELLMTTGYGQGTRKLKITKSGDDWGVKVVWEARTLKPYYNDSVLHNGFVYGFDDAAFVCLDPADGKRKWSAGTKYGFGQVVLLTDQNLLIVMAERGDVALVEATPDDYVELARFKALDGKTWNHPVVNRGKLYVRNGVEMACFDLGTK
jgi:outer membrane protein assembly factor BamB